MTPIQLIQPVEPVRDECGHWQHPGIPDLGEDAAAYKAWLQAQQLTIHQVWLENEDADHPAYISYFDTEDGDISAWEPAPPSDDGWFLLAIFDTEDGPVATFVKREKRTT